MTSTDLAILFEHPDWQKPLFQALERRGVRYAALDLKKLDVGGIEYLETPEGLVREIRRTAAPVPRTVTNAAR